MNVRMVTRPELISTEFKLIRKVEANVVRSTSLFAPRFRYSLLSVAIVVTVVGIVCGVWTDRAHRQRNAVQVLRSGGAHVIYSDEITPGVEQPDLPVWNPEDIRQVADSRWWRDFWCSVIAIDARSQKSFSDYELTQLDQLPKLKVIKVGWTNITPRGIATLRHCPDLVIVDLSATDIDDSAMPHLSSLPNLRYLDLSRTRVSDEGLELLSEHRNLKWLEISKTRVTRLGFEQIQSSLPACKISFAPSMAVTAPKSVSAGSGFAVDNNRDSDPIPERELTVDEQAYFFDQSQLLFNKAPDSISPTKEECERHLRDRTRAVVEFAKRLQHVCVDPVLASVIRDDTEDPMLRAHAVQSLAHVAHPTTVFLLIEILPEGGYVGFSAEWALASLTGVAVGRRQGEGIDESPTQESGIARQALWRAWWSKYGESCKLHAIRGSINQFISEEEWRAKQPAGQSST